MLLDIGSTPFSHPSSDDWARDPRCPCPEPHAKDDLRCQGRTRTGHRCKCQRQPEHYFCAKHDPCPPETACQRCRRRIDGYFERRWRNQYRRTGRVYYLVDGDLVKIGYSRDVPRRVREFQRPLSDVLATEDGGLTREQERHRQFVADRIPGTEWFRVTDRLLDHIAALAADPDNRRSL